MRVVLEENDCGAHDGGGRPGPEGVKTRTPFGSLRRGGEKEYEVVADVLGWIPESRRTVVGRLHHSKFSDSLFLGRLRQDVGI